MNLTSDHPFWTVKNGLIATYPALTESRSCDVTVIGAGITGALVAERLAREGHSVVVLDRRDVCTGSTAASTSLLQYEIDVPLIELKQKIGVPAAERAYQISHQSIDDLRELVSTLGCDCDFKPATSIYLASDRSSAKRLAEEARARRRIGLDVRYHNQQSLSEHFNLPGVAALSSQQAASCDAYQLAHRLLHKATEYGAQIFDRTAVTKFDRSDSGVQLTTDRGVRLTSTWAIIATGYESQSLLKEKVVDLDNTYAVVSEPLASLDSWDPEWILWEAKQPYLYLRITSENRLLAGGEDDAFHSPAKRDRSIEAKSAVIAKKVRELIPSLQWEIEFAWAGTFGKTKDGLAYIGPSPEYPGCLFALGFGGNGITFSAIAANLVADMVAGRPTPDAELFRFGR